MERTVGRVLGSLMSVERAIAFVCFIIMLGVLIADVVGREMFHAGIFGSVRVAVYGLIICAMAGFGLATATNGHLRPAFMDSVFSGPLEAPAIRLGQLASAGILVMMAYAAWKMVAFSLLIDERDLALGIPVWTVELALPVGLALSAFRHLCFAAFPALIPAKQGVME